MWHRGSKRVRKKFWLGRKGKKVPTYGQLEILATSLFDRPIAIFFFPEPPDEENLSKAFRTLPQHELDSLEPDTLLALREAKVLQMSLHELLGGKNEAENVFFRELAVRPSENAVSLARRAKRYMGVSVEEQYKWPTIEQALKNWREIIEDRGIYVRKRSFEQKEISGFCLLDEEFPVISLNNGNTKTRQIFSLFHELGHILLGVWGITLVNKKYIEELTGEARRIEIFCNKFASELLVPTEEFEKRIEAGRSAEENAVSLAKGFKVSREVILRKMLDGEMIDSETYGRLVSEWNDQMGKSEGGSKGGNYYYNQLAYLGNTYLELVFGKYRQGAISQSELSDYTGIKANYLSGVEDLLKWGSE